MKIKSVEFRGIFSGELSYNDTKAYKVGGCDLGFPLYDEKKDKLYLLFGDTFQENNFKYDWRSNTMCLIKEVTDEGRIIIDYFLNNLENKAYALSEGHHQDGFEMTRIPTGAIAANNNYYFYYFSMNNWKLPPDERMNMGGLVKSSDEGKTWEKVNEVSFLNDLEKESAEKLLNEDNNQKEIENKIDPKSKLNHSFTQVFPKKEGDYAYLFAESGYRNNPLRLGRVKLENIEKYEEYEYLVEFKDGKPIFKKGDEARLLMHNKKTPTICDGFMGEMSVIYNKYLNKYCLFTVTTHPEKDKEDHGLFMYFSDTIYGPYKDYIKICSYDDPRFNIEGMYAPMTHEKLTKEDGKIVYLLLSQWIPLYNPIVMKIEFEEK
ncbi:MAG: DUF4185 domain-containing protein [Bacilli bacterium]|nr:DUF4185 domain-containing protein [Bacilli bacterium]MBR1582052.1 DUF4185 domain-containing protein [Bacilli bacterium]